MYCSKCGAQNPDNAQKCSSCNCVLASTKTNATNQDSQKSALAIASFVLGIFGLYCYVGIPSIALGIVALIKIKKSAGLLKGKSFAIAGITISMVWLTYFIVRLVPTVNVVRKFDKKVSQINQLNIIQAAIILFNNEFDSYPPSFAFDGAGQHYCGAMKLCEALMGWDLKGFHRDSVFRSDGTNEAGTAKLYSKEPEAYDPNVRIGPFLTHENTSAYRLNEIFVDVGPFDGNNYVLCDLYTKKRHSGKKIGMPILYYKADTSNNLHDPNTAPTPADSMGNIYNYWDNNELVNLGRPGKTLTHRLANPARFYRNTRNNYVTTERRPYRTDSYILISAGYDGEYGTSDDICNFEWKYRE